MRPCSCHSMSKNHSHVHISMLCNVCIQHTHWPSMRTLVEEEKTTHTHTHTHTPHSSMCVHDIHSRTYCDLQNKQESVRVCTHACTYVCKISRNNSGVPVVNWYKSAVENRWKSLKIVENSHSFCKLQCNIHTPSMQPVVEEAKKRYASMWVHVWSNLDIQHVHVIRSRHTTCSCDPI